MNKNAVIPAYLLMLVVHVGHVLEEIWGRFWIMSMVYAAIMTLNGLGHNVATLVTGRYWDGFAGGMTGIGLILIGTPLLYLLRKKKPDT